MDPLDQSSSQHEIVNNKSLKTSQQQQQNQEHHHHDATSKSQPTRNLDWAYLPKATIPPKEELQPVEKFVADSILSRHLPSSPSEVSQNTGAVGYRAIIDLLRKQDDIAMLRKVFLGLLRTNAIEKLCSHQSAHKRLIHFIFRVQLISRPLEDIISTGMRSMAEQAKAGAGPKKVIFPNDYFDVYEAYLNFLVALISANSVFLPAALNTLWRLILTVDAVTPYDSQLYLNDHLCSYPVETEQQDTDQISVNKKKSNTSIKNKEEREVFIQYQLKLNCLLHGTLKKVLDLVPNGKSEMFPVIASGFPFKTFPLPQQHNYMKQSLIVLQYVPSVERQLLELFVDKCLEIDVEIRIANNGDVNVEEVEKEDDPFKDMGNNTPMLEVKGNSDNNQFSLHKHVKDDKRKEAINKQIKEKEIIADLAEKLDTLMYVLFEHIQYMTTSKQKSPRQYFKLLMPTFESAILTTHRCKFVQFIIIHLCGLDMLEHDEKHENIEIIDKLDQPELCRDFAARLIEIVLDPYRATITRQLAACYLASFVSRTISVCAETVCEAASALLRFAEAYMETFPTEISARNAGRYLGTEGSGEQKDKASLHSLFFTVCQASFYIMCFRGKECIEYYQNAVEYHNNRSIEGEEDDYTEMLDYGDPQLIDISPERWNKVCSYHLNPLRFCLESVRAEFLFLAHEFDLIDTKLLEKLFIEDKKWASSSFRSFTMKQARKKRRKATSIRSPTALHKRRSVGGVGGLGKGSNPLDSFFPFDPYLLRRSYAFVDPHYRHWDGTANAKDDATDDSQGGEETSEVLSIDNIENDNDDYVSEDDDDDDDDDDDEVKKETIDDSEKVSQEEENDEGPTAMSVTSATASMGGSEWTDDLTDTEFTAATSTGTGYGRASWVNELKRGRTYSIGDDCW